MRTVTDDLRQRIDTLLHGGEASIGARTEAVCRTFSVHLARLLGELGIRSLFDRAVYLASASFPWLAAKDLGAADSYETLRVCLDRQPEGAALAAASHVVVTLVQLLERFIGGPLVASLLHEVWPTSFPAASSGKENS